jgi:hypothetical protein
MNTLKDWEELYAGYVIFDRDSGYYISNEPGVAGVAMRGAASRFTKKEALFWISVNLRDDFVIEDAK